MENKQLFEKQANSYNPFFPLVRLEDIIETISDKSIQWILNNYNHIYVEYSESTAITRNKVPTLLRRTGLWISYNNGKEIITEYYKGSNNDVQNYIQWTIDDNWERFDKIKHLDGSITYQHLSEALKQLMFGGNNITNFPDEEDLTTDGVVLSLKDREYEPNNFSGLGRIILRKNIITDKEGNSQNILTQDMFTKSNTIYEIRYNFDLNGEEVTIPKGCVLDFQGGSLRNGCINSIDEIKLINFYPHESLKIQCFFSDSIYIEQSDNIGSYINNIIDGLKKDYRIFFNLTFILGRKTYYVDETINLPRGISMKGFGYSTLLDFTKCKDDIGIKLDYWRGDINEVPIENRNHALHTFGLEKLRFYVKNENFIVIKDQRGIHNLTKLCFEGIFKSAIYHIHYGSDINKYADGRYVSRIWVKDSRDPNDSTDCSIVLSRGDLQYLDNIIAPSIILLRCNCIINNCMITKHFVIHSAVLENHPYSEYGTYQVYDSRVTINAGLLGNYNHKSIDEKISQKYGLNNLKVDDYSTLSIVFESGIPKADDANNNLINFEVKSKSVVILNDCKFIGMGYKYINTEVYKNCYNIYVGNLGGEVILNNTIAVLNYISNQQNGISYLPTINNYSKSNISYENQNVKNVNFAGMSNISLNIIDNSDATYKISNGTYYYKICFINDFNMMLGYESEEANVTINDNKAPQIQIPAFKNKGIKVLIMRGSSPKTYDKYMIIEPTLPNYANYNEDGSVNYVTTLLGHDTDTMLCGNYWLDFRARNYLNSVHFKILQSDNYGQIIIANNEEELPLRVSPSSYLRKNVLLIYNGEQYKINDGIIQRVLPHTLTASEINQLNLTDKTYNIGQIIYDYSSNRFLYSSSTGFKYMHNIATASNNRPTTNLNRGLCIFDTTLNKPIWWTGEKWVDAAGADI